MTTTEQPARPLERAEHAPPRLPRRRLASRLSAGHLLMLLAALVAVVANYAVLRARDDTVRVAVAAVELRPGLEVRAGDLAFTDVRAEPEVLGTLLEPERLPAVEGWIATAAVPAGELVRASDLHAPSAPAAQRAMSVPIEAEHAVAGDLQPGDRVDIIEVEGRTATYLVTDAEVLAVPPPAATGIAGGLRSFSVTIAVDDETALRLAVAIRSGQLEVVRSTGATRATTEHLGDADLGGTTPAGGPAPDEAAPPADGDQP